MKRYLHWLTLSLVLLPGLAAAQSPVNFGVKLGLNLLSTTFDNDGSVVDAALGEENRLGFVGGAFVRINIKKWYLQPELLYTTRNAEVEVTPTSGGATTSADFKSRTLDVPIMVGLKLVDAKVLNIRVMAGPLASFNLSDDSPSELAGQEVGELYNQATIGFQAGGGVDIANITIDLRYEFGFNDAVDANGVTARQNLWQLTAGFKIL